MRTIGIYGGSFDPIHAGHAALASWLSQAGVVDEVWLMVSRLNPLKQGSKPAADKDRMDMARLVANSCPRVKACDFELHRPLPSYTYETLCALAEKYPECRFRLIIGADNWQKFGEWRNAGKIVDKFAPIICPRPGYPLPAKEEVPAQVDVMYEAPLMEISSTLIRDWIREGKEVTHLVPVEVARYIKETGLYR